MNDYPAFIDLKNKKAVVVGGGKVSERKVRSLVKAGASVKIISPVITANLEKLKEKGQVTHIRRNYRKGDLRDAFVVIAGTSSKEINSGIARDAGYLVNVVNSPAEGNYIVPSLVRRGSLSIAISTGGTSPAVSKAVRKEIEGYFGMEFARYLSFIEQVRKKAVKQISDNKKREKFLKSLASEKAFRILRNKGLSELSRKALAQLEGIKNRV